MKKIVCTLILLLTFAFLLPAQEITPAITPEPTPTSICLPCVLHAAGHVTTASGTPIEGATVSMTTAESGTVETVTDSAGYYELIQSTCGCGADADFYVIKEGYTVLHEVHYVDSIETTIDFILTNSGNPGGEVRFVPRHLIHVMLNLIYIDSGIPGELLTIPIVIQGDFTFTNEVHVNTGNQVLAGYGMEITFDPSIVVINTEEGENGISGSPEGFIIAVNTTNPGVVGVSGFDVSGAGVGPESDLHLFTIHWFAQTYNGTTELTINIDHLEDDNSTQVGTPTAQTGSITLETIVCILGDFNSDGSIDIVDALVAAQYYVGLNPPNADIDCGDVNCDGVINIIDALMIAQYFVGLINEFC